MFDRLDGNAVMISGYNRNATVSHSDFSYIGGNAMAAWGYTNETDTDPGRPGVAIENAPYAGIDGTDGNHPRYTQIISNTAREVGLYEKQSSFFMHAKTAETTLNGNVFFNGPRAGINFNDGFGGGDVISNNLVFSACRESGDHGPFNSWDRQPFLTTVRTGKPSMIMKFRRSTTTSSLIITLHKRTLTMMMEVRTTEPTITSLFTRRLEKKVILVGMTITSTITFTLTSVKACAWSLRSKALTINFTAIRPFLRAQMLADLDAAAMERPSSTITTTSQRLAV